MDDYGMDEGFFDGAFSSAKGVLIGGGLAQLGTLATKAFAAKYSKYASLIGLVLGGGASLLMMRKPESKEAGQQGLAAALIVGVPRVLEDLVMPSAFKGDEELGAYTSEYAGVPGVDIQGPIEIMDAGSGSAGMIGAITSEYAGAEPPPVEVLSGAFGATGF